MIAMIHLVIVQIIMHLEICTWDSWNSFSFHFFIILYQKMFIEAVIQHYALPFWYVIKYQSSHLTCENLQCVLHEIAVPTW